MHFLAHEKIMLRCLACVMVLFLTACGGTRDDVPLAFTSLLNGRQVVPSTLSSNLASGLLTYDPETHILTATVIATGIPATAVQLHEGNASANGPLVLSLFGESGTPVWSARVTLTDAQLRTLEDERFYLEVQTAAFPTGELRGQVLWEFPSREQARELQQYRQQSATVELQLQQLQRILDARDDGISWNLFIRF